MNAPLTSAANATNASHAARRHALRIFLVGSEFWRNSGGIQYVNRLLVRALADFSRSTPMHAEGFAYLDAAQDVTGVPGTNGFSWHAFGGRRGAMAIRFAQRLLAVRPHLVIFTHVNLLPLAGFVHRLAPATRTALLAHGVEVWNPLSPSVTHTLRKLARVITPSVHTREQLIARHGVAPARVDVVPHGLDPEWAAAAMRAEPLARRGNTLLCVARLAQADAYKGVDILLRALPYIRSRCPQARCVIAGDGDDRARLEALARELGVAAVVEFRGELDSASMLHAYQEADLFVLPSRGEGFGIVFAEAMWCGLPVVAARAAAAPEVVADGETGVLVPPQSPEALASAVSGLLLLADERERMGQAARRRVEQHYLYPQFVARWQHWLARCAPEAVYLARHAAVFAPPAPESSRKGRAQVRAAETVGFG